VWAGRRKEVIENRKIFNLYEVRREAERSKVTTSRER
jgi:hypothetical protein